MSARYNFFFFLNEERRDFLRKDYCNKGERTMTIEDGGHYNEENTPDYEICKILKGQVEWDFFFIQGRVNKTRKRGVKKWEEWIQVV